MTDIPLQIERLHGVGVVVSDVERSMAEFSRFFGIAQWRLAELHSGRNFQICANGRDVEAKIRRATGAVGHVRFDLIEPVSGNTSFARYHEQFGSKPHDLTTHVLSPEAFAVARKRLQREGIGIAESLYLGADFEVHYLDSVAQFATSLKIVVSRHARDAASAESALGDVVSMKLTPADQRLPIDRPYHACVVTRNRRLSVRESFQRVFGVAKWFEYDNETGATVSGAHYRGQPARSRFRLTLGRSANFAVEVVEMIYGDNVYQDMLDTRGEGIHHLMTTSCEIQELNSAKAALAAEGYSIVQDGEAGPIYYGYLAADNRIADLAVEMICPLSPDWKESQDRNFWEILEGSDYV